jgi:flagellar motor switch protein FliM
VEPILSKQEIAELLTSIRDSGVSEGSGSELSPVSSHSPPYREISLFELGTAHEAPAPIDHLEIIINQFRPLFSTALSHYLQRTVVIDLIESDFLPFSSYLSSENGQNVATIIKLSPLKFPGIVSCDARLCSILLEFLMGGTTPSESIAATRSRTKLELHIIQKVMDQACAALESVFQPVIPLTCCPIRTIDSCRSISQFEAIMPMAVFAMNISVDACSGHLDLLLPVMAFDPYRESLATVTQQSSPDQDRWTGSIEESLEKTTVTLMARTGVLDLSVRQLIEMRTGDIFFVDHEPGSAVEILVEGTAKFAGTMGHRNRKRNIRITSLAA